MQAGQQFKQQTVRMPGGPSGGVADAAAAATAAAFEQEDATKQLFEKECIFDQEQLDRYDC